LPLAQRKTYAANLVNEERLRQQTWLVYSINKYAIAIDVYD